MESSTEEQKALDFTTFTDVLKSAFAGDELLTIQKQLQQLPIECLLEWLNGHKHAIPHNDSSVNYEEDLVNLMAIMLEHCIPSSLTKHLAPDKDRSMINSCQRKSVPLLRFCVHVVKKCIQSMDRKVLSLGSGAVRRVSVRGVITCAAHMDPHPWSSEDSRQAAMEFVDALCELCHCSSVGQLLCGEDVKDKASDETADGDRKLPVFSSGILGAVINHLKPCFTKDSLNSLVSEQHALCWCVQHVKHPHLSEHFSNLLPALLLLVDDYRTENQVLGISTFRHVIDNMNAVEVRWYGRGDVIYQALHHRLYSNEVGVIEVLHPCLLSLLSAIEENPKKPKTFRKVNRYDDVFQIILNSMEFESKLVLRRAYTQHLTDFVNVLGITTLRHLKRLLRVILGYLEVSDGLKEESRINMLRALVAVVRNCWPRIPHHLNKVVKSLLKLIVNLEDAKDTICLRAQSELTSLITQCFSLLTKLGGEKLQDELNLIAEESGHALVREIILKSMTSPEIT